MTASPNIPRFPRFNQELIPPDEQDSAFELWTAITSLRSYTEDFLSALSLFDFAWERVTGPHSEDFQSWLFVAARDGAMTMYHFLKTIVAIRGGFGKCKTVAALVDHDKLKVAEKLFRSRFPDVEDLRHTVAHSADFGPEWYRLNKEYEGTGIKAGPGITMKNVLENRRFTNTTSEAAVSYEISQDTFLKLCDIVLKIYAAFGFEAK